MNFYLATSFIFPRSLRLRLFSLCFVATHLPLIAWCGWSLVNGRLALTEFLLLIAATVVGTGVALLGIGALLNPIHVLADTLHRNEGPAPVLPEMGDIIHTLYAGVHRAATATRSHLEDLSSAAFDDPLTGIANRRGFLDALGRLPAAQRKGCIAIVDIDFFKQVNDTLGHDEGDRVLCAFADRLSGHLRRADMIARWGGEEFVIFFRNCIEDEADSALCRIASRLHDDPVGEVRGRALTFSAGLCSWQDGDVTIPLRHADEALYMAKQSGRDRVCRAAPNAPA